MKPFFAFVLSGAFALVFIPAWSQTVSPTPSPTTHHHTAPPWPDKRPRIREVKKRIGVEYTRISQALKKGKITKAQTFPLKKNVLAVHEKMLDFIRQNKVYGLNADQENQLMTMLDQAETTTNSTVNTPAATPGLTPQK